MSKEGLPWGPVVKNPPSNARGAVRSLVGDLRSHMPWGNKAHALQLLSPHALEPAHHNY